jgi:hypothetical protein
MKRPLFIERFRVFDAEEAQPVLCVAATLGRRRMALSAGAAEK